MSDKTKARADLIARIEHLARRENELSTEKAWTKGQLDDALKEARQIGCRESSIDKALGRARSGTRPTSKSAALAAITDAQRAVSDAEDWLVTARRCLGDAVYEVNDNREDCSFSEMQEALKRGRNQSAAVTARVA